MRSFLYAAEFTPADEGGFIITFPDIPEAITQGESIEDGIEQASDALEEAIVARMHLWEELPAPSAPQAGQYLIPVPAQTAFKAALYEEVRSEGVSKVELAARLGIDEKEVRRLLDPHHPSKLPRIEEVLERAGKRIVVQVRDEQEMLAHA